MTCAKIYLPLKKEVGKEELIYILNSRRIQTLRGVTLREIVLCNACDKFGKGYRVKRRIGIVEAK